MEIAQSIQAVVFWWNISLKATNNHCSMPGLGHSNNRCCKEASRSCLQKILFVQERGVYVIIVKDI